MEYCQESCFKRFWGNVTVRICKSIDWGCLSRGKDVFPPNKQSAENVRINFAPRVCPKLFRRVMVQHGPLWFLVYQSLRCHVLINHGIILVLVIGGRDYIQPSRRQYVLGIQAVYIYIHCQFDGYMLPIPFYNLKKSVWIKLVQKETVQTLRTSTCFQRWTLFDNGKNMKKAQFFLVGLVGQLTPLTNLTLFGVQTLRGVPQCFNRACTLCKFV